MIRRLVRPVTKWIVAALVGLLAAHGAALNPEDIAALEAALAAVAAAGVGVLWELFKGRLPFVGSNGEEVQDRSEEALRRLQNVPMPPPPRVPEVGEQ